MITKIIHITLGKANPNKMNGINKVVNSLATYQVKSGMNVEVWGITQTPEAATPDRPYDLQLFKPSKLFGLDPKLILTMAIQPDTVRFHLHGSFNLELYRIAKKLNQFNHKYIYTSHGAFNEIAMERSYLKKRLYTYFFEKHIVSNAYKMHFIGASEIDGAKKFFSLDQKYFLVPNGQEVVSETDDLLAKDSNKIILGFIGRLDIQTKGLDILLAAIKDAEPAIQQNIELWIIGGGSGQVFIEEYIEKYQLQNTIKLLGPLFGKDKFDAIQQMNFLCLNSRNEGMPGVVLESLSYGTPVIISKATNLGTEVAASLAGFVLPENNKKQLRETIIKAISLSEKNYQQMKSNAVQMIAQKFDWQLIAAKMIENYA
jgi:glycosyltransferase involved in cell wall biosynthesis